MLIARADPGFDATDATRAPVRNPSTLAETDGQPDGFVDFLTALRTEVVAFGKPVAYVHGDSHYFRIDKPFLSAQGQRLENFTRVETFGDHQENGINDNHWLKVFVDPKSREVFSYQTQIVSANRVAVPAPEIGKKQLRYARRRSALRAASYFVSRNHFAGRRLPMKVAIRCAAGGSISPRTAPT